MAWDVHNPLVFIPEDGAQEEPVETVYSEDGVDLSLIRWTLAMTPLDRLRVAQDTYNSYLRLRRELRHDG